MSKLMDPLAIFLVAIKLRPGLTTKPSESSDAFFHAMNASISNEVADALVLHDHNGMLESNKVASFIKLAKGREVPLGGPPQLQTVCWSSHLFCGANQRLPMESAMENATTLIDIFQDEDPVTMALVYKPELVCKDAQRGEPTKGQNTA